MRPVLVLSLLLCLPAQARADGDGSYCHGPGYLAYEARFGATPEQHVLHVIRFSSNGGILPEQKILLDDFQVHGMACHATAIEIAGWTLRYHVDLTTPTRPTVTQESGQFDVRRTPAHNLGGPAGVVDLDADGAPCEFLLVIARASRRLARGIETYTSARLIRLDTPMGHRVIETRHLFETVSREMGESNR